MPRHSSWASWLHGMWTRPSRKSLRHCRRVGLGQGSTGGSGKVTFTQTDLGKQVRHDGTVHHGSLCPFGCSVAVRIQQTAVVMPARKIVSKQETRAEDSGRGGKGGWFWGREGGNLQWIYLSLNCRLSLADWLALKTWLGGNHVRSLSLNNANRLQYMGATSAKTEDSLGAASSNVPLSTEGGFGPLEPGQNVVKSQ